MTDIPSLSASRLNDLVTFDEGRRCSRSDVFALQDGEGIGAHGLMRIERANYLHSGGALDVLAQWMSVLPRIPSKATLLSELGKHSNISDQLMDVIQAYSANTSGAGMSHFARDVSHSVALQSFFRSLNCRGFSFIADTNVGLSFRRRHAINFSLGLFAAKNIYYPRRVRRYLPRIQGAHASHGKYPAIAFALGRYVGDDLFVLVMQSDLVFQGPSFIREHFRGWRKILFSQVLSHARSNTHKVHLCRSEDVLRTCHPNFSPPASVPAVWRQIYDETAAFFGMEAVQLDRRLDIQTLRCLPARYSRNFFVLPGRHVSRGGREGRNERC